MPSNKQKVMFLRDIFVNLKASLVNVLKVFHLYLNPVVKVNNTHPLHYSLT